jgi:hypothetical protein
MPESSFWQPEPQLALTPLCSSPQPPHLVLPLAVECTSLVPGTSVTLPMQENSNAPSTLWLDPLSRRSPLLKTIRTSQNSWFHFFCIKHDLFGPFCRRLGSDFSPAADDPKISFASGGTLAGTIKTAKAVGIAFSAQYVSNTWNVRSTARFLAADAQEEPGVYKFILVSDSILNFDASTYFPWFQIYGNSPSVVNVPAGSVITMGNFTWEGDATLSGGKWMLNNANIASGGTAAHFNLKNVDVVFSGDSYNSLAQQITGTATIVNKGNLEWLGGLDATADGTILVNYGTAWLGMGEMNGYFSNGTTYLGRRDVFEEGYAFGSSDIFVLAPTSVLRTRIVLNNDINSDHSDSTGFPEFTYLDGTLVIENIVDPLWATISAGEVYEIIAFEQNKAAGRFKAIQTVDFPAGLGAKLRYDWNVDRTQFFPGVKVIVCTIATDSECNSTHWPGSLLLVSSCSHAFSLRFSCPCHFSLQCPQWNPLQFVRQDPRRRVAASQRRHHWCCRSTRRGLHSHLNWRFRPDRRLIFSHSFFWRKRCPSRTQRSARRRRHPSQSPSCSPRSCSPCCYDALIK